MKASRGDHQSVTGTTSLLPPSLNKCTSSFSPSQTFSYLTNFVANISDIYDFIVVYYETTFEDESDDINLVS